MAKRASNYLFLLLLSILTVSASGALVGFSLNARGNRVSSSPATRVRVYVADHRVLSTLSSSGVSVDLYLNESLVEQLLPSEPSAVSWLKSHVVTSPSHVNIKSIVLGRSNSWSERFAGKNVLPMFLSKLKLLHSALSRVHLDKEIKVSVAFSLSSLENMNTTDERDLQRIFSFIKKTKSFVIIEASGDGELSMGSDLVVQSMIKKATLAFSSLPNNGIPIILTTKMSPVVVNATAIAEFITEVSESLESNIEIRGRIDELYAEASSVEDFAQKELKREQEQIFPLFRRELVNSLKTTIHDSFNSPTTVLPTAPVTLPPDIPTPTIVTVPATNPVTITPTNPDSSPLPIPYTTPVNIPPATPVNPPAAPLTNPATTPPISVPGAQPITNPVTTYPAPAGNVPATTPVTNPVTPPAQTNAPAIPGQSWCVARTGASETSLQSGLDYACGNGADCSQIQQGGSCYSPDTVQNHASFAFNSYYQKNPAPTSCDFGGTAVIVNTNPSTGSCIYPSSSSSSTSTSTPTPTTPSTPTTPTTPTPTPVSTAPPATTTATPLPGVPGSVTPPSVLNSSSGNPTSVFGSDSPPVVNTSTSTSSGLQPLIRCFALVTFIVTGIIILHI